MQFDFAPAKRSNRKLRLALDGTAGSGKTKTALRIGYGICQAIEAKEGRPATMVVLDTEHGSSELYAPADGESPDNENTFEFRVAKLADFDPRNYVTAIKAMERIADVVIIDSLSHAWSGEGGALSQVDNAAKRQGGNTFGAWRDVTPVHNQLVDAMLRCKAHLIATMRTKTEYSVDKDSNGKVVIRKLGLAPIQRDGMEYEFDVVADLDSSHNFMVGKTRYPAWDGKVVNRPGSELGAELVNWLSAAPTATTDHTSPSLTVGGPTVVAIEPIPNEVGRISEDQANQIHQLFDDLGLDDAKRLATLGKRGVSEVESLTETQAIEMIAKMSVLAAQRRAEKQEATMAAHQAQRDLEGQTAVEQIALQIEGASPEEAAQQAGARPDATPAEEIVIPDQPIRVNHDKPAPKRPKKTEPAETALA